MKEKQFHFVYITTNIINNKQYVGDHSTNNLEKDNYLGSGKYFIKALNEYGKENFKREIINFFDTKQQSFDAQEKYINEYNTLVPNGYNIHPTGGSKAGYCSEEARKKISESNKGCIPWNKGKHGIYSKETLEKIAKGSKVHSSSMKNKHYDEKVKQKMKKSAQTRDNTSFRTEEYRKRQSEINIGKHSRVFSDEHKQKLSESHKGQIPWNKKLI